MRWRLVSMTIGVPVVALISVAVMAATSSPAVGAARARFGPTYATLARDLKRSDARVSALQASLSRARKEVGGTGTLQARLRTVASVLGLKGSLNRRSHGLRERVGSQQRDVQSLRGQNASLTDQNASLTGQNATLTSQNAALTLQIGTTSAPPDPLAGELTDAENTVGGTGDLSTRLSALGTSLGGSGDLTTRVAALDAALGGTSDAITRVQGVENALRASGAQTNVTADVAALRGELTGTPGANLEIEMGALNTTLGGSGTTQSRASALSSQNATSADVIANAQSTVGGTGSLSTQLATLSTNLGGSGSTLTLQLSALDTALGGSSNATTRVQGVENALRASGAQTNVTSDLTALRAELTTTPGANLEADITTLSSALGGTGTTVEAQITDVTAGIDSSTSVASTAITNVKSILGGSSSDIAGDLQVLDSALGGAGTTGGRIGDPAGNPLLTTLSTIIGGSATTSLTTQLGLTSGSTSLAAQIAPSSASIESAITAVDSELLTSPTGVLLDDLGTARRMLVATPGATLQSDAETLNVDLTGVANSGITTQVRVIGLDHKLLAAPVGNLSADLDTARGLLVGHPGTTLQSDVATVNNGLNGTASGSTTQARETTLDGNLLDSPVGNVSADLDTARGLLVTTPGATLQSDVATVNNGLNGTASGSTTQAREGAAMLNTSPSNLQSVVDGNGSGDDLATALGDPVAGTTGLAGLIADGQQVSNGGLAAGGVTAFNSDSSFNAQLTDFLAILSGNTGMALPDGTYSSLSDVLNHITTS